MSGNNVSDATANPVFWNCAAGFPAFKAINCTAQITAGGLLIHAGRGYPRVQFSDLELDTASINAISCTYRASGKTGRANYMFFCRNHQEFNSDRHWELPSLNSDGEPHSFALDSRAINMPWTWGISGQVKQLTLEFECDGDAEIEICELKFFFNPEHPIKMRNILAQIADPQIGFHQDYDNQLRRLHREIDLINGSDCQCVIICGDLMNLPGENEFKVFQAELSRLHLPYFIVPGNHDVHNNSRDLFRRFFGPLYYAADLPLPGYRLIALDTNLWQHPVPGETEKMEKMLTEELDKAKRNNQKIIIAGHCPIFVNSADEEEKYYNLPIPIRNRFREIFRNYPVKAYLGGHTHTAFAWVWQGVLLSNSETTSYAFDKVNYGFRRIIFDDEAVYFNTVPVP